jgi:hypothetical protein
MASTKSLTGGSGDVNPQLLHAVLQQDGTNATILTIPIPIPRFPAAKNKAFVMEVLKASYYLETGSIPVSDPSAGVQWGLATTDNAALLDATTFDQGSLTQAGALNTGTFGAVNPYVTDFTDGAGHGLLIGTENIYLRIQSAFYTTASRITLRLSYRYKLVDVYEWIGIVQSQTSTS